MIAAAAAIGTRRLWTRMARLQLALWTMSAARGFDRLAERVLMRIVRRAPKKYFGLRPLGRRPRDIAKGHCQGTLPRDLAKGHCRDSQQVHTH